MTFPRRRSHPGLDGAERSSTGANVCCADATKPILRPGSAARHLPDKVFLRVRGDKPAL